MISSYLIDPEVSDLGSPEEKKRVELQLSHILMTIVEDGILLRGTCPVWQKSFKELFKQIANQDPFLRELVVKVVREYSVSIGITPSNSVEESLAKIAKRHKPDFFICDRMPYPDTLNDFKTIISKSLEYHLSPSAIRRYKWRLSEQEPIDQKNEDEIRSHFSRITCFAKTVSIYDTYIAKSDGHKRELGRKKESISLLLDSWLLRSNPLNSRGQCAFNVYAINYDSFDSNCFLGILRELSVKYKIKINLYLKNDPNKIFHARHIETENNIIQIDPGIDVLDSDNNLRRVLLKNARNDSKHLLQIRSLANAIDPIQIMPQL